MVAGVLVRESQQLEDVRSEQLMALLATVGADAALRDFEIATARVEVDLQLEVGQHAALQPCVCVRAAPRSSEAPRL